MGLLQGFSILDKLSPEEMKYLNMFCQERVIIKGEKVFKEGDEANSLYFLKNGGISIYKEIEGIDTHIGEILAEDILGEMAIFGGEGRRNASAIANQDSTLIIIMSFSIKEIANKNPDLLSKIQNIVEDRIIKNKLIKNKK